MSWFDLSNILFVNTASQMDTIPVPLLDRMEVTEKVKALFVSSLGETPDIAWPRN